MTDQLNMKRRVARGSVPSKFVKSQHRKLGWTSSLRTFARVMAARGSETAAEWLNSKGCRFVLAA